MKLRVAVLALAVSSVRASGEVRVDDTYRPITFEEPLEEAAPSSSFVAIVKSSTKSNLTVSDLDSIAASGSTVVSVGSDGDLIDAAALRRRLQNVNDKYRPLDCNVGLPDTSAGFDIDAPTGGCDPFSADPLTPGQPLTIQCGACVYMDQEGDVVLPDGLNVVGKLVFPDNHKVRVVTPAVWVQGELQIRDTNEVTPENKSVEFFLTGSADRTFTPHDGQATTAAVNFGPKPFIVAGGKLDIDGYKAGCPAWTTIEDVYFERSGLEEGTYAVPAEIPGSCDRTIAESDFESGTGMFRGAEGVITDVVTEADGNSFMRLSNRTRNWQGLIFDIPKAKRDCLLADTDYVLQGRFRLSKQDGSGDLTECSSTGLKCPKFHTHRRNLHNHDSGFTKMRLGRDDVVGADFPGNTVGQDVVTDGEWFTWSGRFQFSGDETRDDVVALVLKVANGPEPGVVIDVDDISVFLPGPEYYPTEADVVSGDVCNDLFPADSSADGYIDGPNAPFYPFPLKSNSGSAELHVMSEPDPLSPHGVNHFYRLAHRYYEWNSLAFDLTQGCLNVGYYYKIAFRARIRYPGEFPNARINLVVWEQNGGHYHWYGPKATGGAAHGWVDYEGHLVVDERMAAAKRVEFRLNTGHSVMNGNKWSDIDYDDISISLVHGPIMGLVVQPEVAGCWGSGSDALVTSHTHQWNSEQIMTIDNVDDSPRADGNVVLRFAEALPKNPTTNGQDPMAGTEVALLDRNVRFSADTDVANHGGHLQVVHTYGVRQKIRGVDIDNFGQYKKSGRFPIHFMLCDSMDGSIIEANLVRNSNYRGIAINGASDVTISHNVAYKTRGHTFSTFSGKEYDIIFESNLAVRTYDRRLEGWWTAGFFIRSPQNVYRNNVAAGMEGYGFVMVPYHTIAGGQAFVDLEPTGTFNPRHNALGAFEDNAAHSCQSIGLRIHDYHPRNHDMQVFRRFRSYKNKDHSIYVSSMNIELEDFYIADVLVRGLDLEESDLIKVTNSTIVGWSDTYRQQVNQQNIWHPCVNEAARTDRLIGIEVKTFSRWRNWPALNATPPGVQFEDLTFQGFQDTGCARASQLYFQPDRRLPHQEWYIDTEGMEDADLGSNVRIDLCTAENIEVQDVIITDRDSSLHPDGAGTFAGVSQILSDHPFMQVFAGGTCHNVSDMCYTYCENTCLRHATYSVSPYDTEDVLLVVTDKDSGTTVEIEGNWQCSKKTVDGVSVPDVYHNTYPYDLRKFSVPLPAGNYEAEFTKNGVPYWPKFVEGLIYERDPGCGAVQVGSIEMKEPPAVTEADCQELVFNGDAELGNYTGWYHTNGGVTTLPGAGMDGSTAFFNNRWRRDQGIGFYLDMRCLKLMQGHEYEFTGYVHLATADGTPYECNTETYSDYSGCPRVQLQSKRWDEDTNSQAVDGWGNIAMTVRPYVKEGFNLVHGTFVISEKMANADSVYVWFFGGHDSTKLYVDNVSLHPLIRNADPAIIQARSSSLSTAPTPPICPEEFIMNGDLEQITDSTQYWRIRSYPGKLRMIEGGADGSGHAIEAYDRTYHHPWQGPIQWIDITCLKEDQEYEVSARFRLTRMDGTRIVCNPLQGNSYNEENCPVLTMNSRTVSGYERYVRVATTVDAGDETTWGTLHAIFKPHPYFLESYRGFLFAESSAKNNIALDDVSLKPYTKDCTNVVKNGDFQVGTPASWTQAGASAAPVIADEGADSSDKSLKLTGRDNRDDRLQQELDKGCIDVTLDYVVEAKVKMYQAGTATLFACDPNVIGGAEECPFADLRTETGEARGRVIGSVVGNADGDGWYPIRGVFNFFPYDMESTSLLLRFYRAPANIDLLIDNVVIAPLDGASTV